MTTITIIITTLTFIIVSLAIILVIIIVIIIIVTLIIITTSIIIIIIPIFDRGVGPNRGGPAECSVLAVQRARGEMEPKRTVK